MHTIVQSLLDYNVCQSIYFVQTSQSCWSWQCTSASIGSWEHIHIALHYTMIHRGMVPLKVPHQFSYICSSLYASKVCHRFCQLCWRWARHPSPSNLLSLMHQQYLYAIFGNMQILFSLVAGLEVCSGLRCSLFSSRRAICTLATK